MNIVYTEEIGVALVLSLAVHLLRWVVCQTIHCPSILLKETRVSVCLCAKFDQFLPVRSHFDTKRPVHFFHIATFPSPTFGSLFAFHCPLFFTKNNNLKCRDVLKTLTVTTQDRPLNCKQQQWFSGTVHDSDLSDLSSNLIQVLQIFLTHYCLRLTTFTFNKWREYN